MDINNLKDNYHLLFEYMRTKRYSEGYIKRISAAIRFTLKNGERSEIKNYSDLLLLRLIHTKSKGFIELLRIYFRVVEDFDKYGIYPDPTHHHRVLVEQRRNNLLPAYYEYINSYEQNAKENGILTSSINTVKNAGINFFSYLQNYGYKNLIEPIPEEVITGYFYENGKVIRRYSAKYHIVNLLKSCSTNNTSGECDRVLKLLPPIKNIKNKLYQDLQPEEIVGIKTVLEDKKSGLCLRDIAIVTICMYTGMRASDICELKFSNFDWKNNTIALKQKKTGEKLHIPLRPIVGNAIYDYIKYERDNSEQDYIFLSKDSKHFNRRIYRNTVTEAIKKVCNVAGVRINGEKHGSHLFRHNIITSLLHLDTKVPIISSIVGHTSPRSIEPYLNSDLTKLKSCALSMEGLPINLKIFDL